MTTQITHPARTDLPRESPERTGRRSTTSSRWALAGVGAGLAGIGTVVTSGMVGVVYQKQFTGTVDGVSAELETKAGVLFAFHSITMLGAVLLVVFAAGLHRRLQVALPESTIPTVALLGLAGTGVVSVLGAGLDTEFMMAMAFDDGAVADSSAAMYNHWIGTIPWLWVLAGLAGLALYGAARQLAVPRWIGRVGLVLGGLTVLLGISPLEYLSGMTGALLVLITAVGFTAGDRAHRAA